MVHPYANPAGYMSASRDTISSQGYGPKRGEDCRPPRRKRFSALSFMNMRNSKDLSSPRPSPATTVSSPTSTIVAPSPAHSRGPSVTRSRAPSISRTRAPSVAHSRAPSAPSSLVSTPPSMVPTPPSIVRKPSSGSRRGRDPPFIVKSSQPRTFEVALPAKTRHDQPGGRAHRDYPRTGGHAQNNAATLATTLRDGITPPSRHFSPAQRIAAKVQLALALL